MLDPAPREHPPVEVIGVNDLRTRIEDDIYEATNGVVQDGPFKGMQIYPDKGWAETNHAAELLGCFEQELQEFIEIEIERLARLPNPKIANVGCAEGYYAVGLARRLPNATIHVVEPHERSLAIALKNAENNGVTIVPVDIAIALENPDYVVMDCEGFETEYLDPVKHPGLRNASIVVELHQRPDADDVLSVVRTKLQHTHGGKLVFEGSRNPNASNLLWPCSSFERWLAVCEWRPCIMCWAVLEPAK